MTKDSEVAYILSFYPRGRNCAYFCSTGSAFRDTGQLSKLPYLGRWAIGQSFRSCTHTFFLPQGFEVELIFALRAAVSERQDKFQNCHICHEILQIGQSSRHILSFYHRRAKLSLFLLYGQRFLRYGLFFKISIY